MIVRFGHGPNFTDERFAVVDLEWAKGKTTDEIEESLKE